jgi:hypothetical protein
MLTGALRDRTLADLDYIILHQEKVPNGGIPFQIFDSFLAFEDRFPHLVQRKGTLVVFRASALRVDARGLSRYMDKNDAETRATLIVHRDAKEKAVRPDRSRGVLHIPAPEGGPDVIGVRHVKMQVTDLPGQPDRCADSVRGLLGNDLRTDQTRRCARAEGGRAMGIGHVRCVAGVVEAVEIIARPGLRRSVDQYARSLEIWKPPEDRRLSLPHVRKDKPQVLSGRVASYR